MSTSSSTHISEPSPPACQDAVIQLEGVRLSLPGNSGDVDILNGIDLAINARQTVAVLGPSGAGKTSLLMVMAGLEQISGGSISLSGKPITHMDEDMLAQLRRNSLGWVTGLIICQNSYQAENNNVLQLPVLSRPARGFCWQTSQQAIWIVRQARLLSPNYLPLPRLSGQRWCW